MIFGRAIVLLVAALVVARLPHVRRARAAATSRRHIEHDLPDAIDHLVVLIRSGLTPTQAVPELAANGPATWRPAWQAAADALAHGQRFVDAIGRLVDRAGPAARTIVDTLVAADHFGQPLAPALDRLAAEGQAARRRIADISARQLPVRLSFPLVCCTLPAFVLLTVAPLIAGAVSSLHTRGASP